MDGCYCHATWLCACDGCDGWTNGWMDGCIDAMPCDSDMLCDSDSDIASICDSDILGGIAILNRA